MRERRELFMGSPSCQCAVHECLDHRFKTHSGYMNHVAVLAKGAVTLLVDI